MTAGEWWIVALLFSLHAGQCEARDDTRWAAAYRIAALAALGWAVGLSPWTWRA